MSFFTVHIDAGHGGANHGTVNHTGLGSLVEKDYTLGLALDLRRVLEGLGVDVSMSRTKDIDPSFFERALLAHNRRADFVLSLHVNAHRDPDVRGAEIYAIKGRPFDVALAELFRTRMPAQLCAGRKARIRRAENKGASTAWMQAAINVLKQYDRPAVLVECGYNSNTNDRRRLLDTGVRRRLVLGLASGVLDALDAIAEKKGV